MTSVSRVEEYDVNGLRTVWELAEDGSVTITEDGRTLTVPANPETAALATQLSEQAQDEAALLRVLEKTSLTAADRDAALRALVKMTLFG